MEQEISSARITDTVLMIRPVGFDLNEETLESNAFQDRTRSDTPTTINAKALAEFDIFVTKLRRLGVEVIVLATHQSHIRQILFFQIIGCLFTQTEKSLPIRCKPSIAEKNAV